MMWLGRLGVGAAVGVGAGVAAVSGARAAETATGLAGAIFLHLFVRFETRLAVRLGWAVEAADSTRIFCLGIIFLGLDVIF